MILGGLTSSFAFGQVSKPLATFMYQVYYLIHDYSSIACQIITAILTAGLMCWAGTILPNNLVHNHSGKEIDYRKLT